MIIHNQFFNSDATNLCLVVYEKIHYLMNFTNGKYKLNNISFYCLMNLLKFNNTVRIAVIILKVSMMFLVVSSSNFRSNVSGIF